MDTFIQYNTNMVQQRMYTESKENPQEAFRFAVVYGEVMNQHKTLEGQRVERNQMRTSVEW